MSFNGVVFAQGTEVVASAFSDRLPVEDQETIIERITKPTEITGTDIFNHKELPVVFYRTDNIVICIIGTLATDVDSLSRFITSIGVNYKEEFDIKTLPEKIVDSLKPHL